MCVYVCVFAYPLKKLACLKALFVSVNHVALKVSKRGLSTGHAARHPHCPANEGLQLVRQQRGENDIVPVFERGTETEMKVYVNVYMCVCVCLCAGECVFVCM